MLTSISARIKALCTFYLFFGKPRRKKHCVVWMFCSQIVWEIMVLVRLLDLSPVKTVTKAVNANRLQSFPDKQAVNFVSMHSLQESEISSRMQVALTVYLSVVVSGDCNGTVGFPSLTWFKKSKCYWVFHFDILLTAPGTRCTRHLVSARAHLARLLTNDILQFISCQKLPTLTGRDCLTGT